MFSLKKETEFEDTNVLVPSITFLQKLSKKQEYQREDIINMIQTIPDVYENGINFYLAKLNLKKFWAQFL